MSDLSVNRQSRLSVKFLITPILSSPRQGNHGPKLTVAFLPRFAKYLENRLPGTRQKLSDSGEVNDLVDCQKDSDRGLGQVGGLCALVRQRSCEEEGMVCTPCRCTLCGIPQRSLRLRLGLNSKGLYGIGALCAEISTRFKVGLPYQWSCSECTSILRLIPLAWKATQGIRAVS